MSGAASGLVSRSTWTILKLVSGCLLVLAPGTNSLSTNSTFDLMNSSLGISSRTMNCFCELEEGDQAASREKRGLVTNLFRRNRTPPRRGFYPAVDPSLLLSYASNYEYPGKSEDAAGGSRADESTSRNLARAATLDPMLYAAQQMMLERGSSGGGYHQQQCNNLLEYLLVAGAAAAAALILIDNGIITIGGRKRSIRSIVSGESRFALTSLQSAKQPCLVPPSSSSRKHRT